MNTEPEKLVARDPNFYEVRAKVAKALAHPTRLLIVDHLGKQDCCVQELTDLAGCDQSTVSRHLAVLRESGLVASKKVGTSQRYYLTCNCLDGFFQCFDSVLSNDKESSPPRTCGEDCRE